MYTFFTHSRSAWRKSVANAARLVAAGRMTEEEFAAAPASSDPRDPDPAALLATARHNYEAVRAWEAKAADRAAKEETDRQARAAKIEELRHVRCWRLAGFFIEDLSWASYTLAEIAAWVDWEAPKFRAKHPSVIAVADGPGDLAVNFSDYFQEVCGGRVPAEVNHDRACRALAAYVAQRRAIAAPNN